MTSSLTELDEASVWSVLSYRSGDQHINPRLSVTFMRAASINDWLLTKVLCSESKATHGRDLTRCRRKIKASTFKRLS